MGDAEMSNWSTERILGALANLDEAALPDDFLEIRTAEYRLLRYPHGLPPPIDELSTTEVPTAWDD
jgi:hypothetical protein